MKIEPEGFKGSVYEKNKQKNFMSDKEMEENESGVEQFTAKSGSRAAKVERQRPKISRNMDNNERSLGTSSGGKTTKVKKPKQEEYENVSAIVFDDDDDITNTSIDISDNINETDGENEVSSKDNKSDNSTVSLGSMNDDSLENLLGGFDDDDW